MRIAIAGLVTKKITSDVAGGTEIFTKLLVDGLVDKGHEVTLYCAKGSQTKASHQVEICESGEAMGSESNLEFVYPYTLLEVRRILEDIAKNNFDILHVNFLKTFMMTFFADQIQIPILYTVHRDFFEFPKIYDVYNRIGFHSNEHFAFVSKNALGKSILKNQCDFVYNGIQASDYPFYKGQDNDSFIWLSRVDPKKGPKEAMLAAKKAGVKLIMSGDIDRDKYRAYFDSEIAPNIDDSIRFEGPISKDSKIYLYQHAKAFIFPIQWEEPFGLVVIEAMSCGTPVITFNRGAMSEIVEDGVSGLVVPKEQGVDGLAEAIRKLNSLSKEEYGKMRRNCRERVKNMFTIEKTVENYEALYRKLVE
jgi:glycosyltransferase involved in cell wall biosynthesis